MKKNSGFTLLELLVVIAIIGILASVGFGQYRGSQIKARDGQRKTDLGNIARALEMYYNDNDAYPLSNISGEILIDSTPVAWGQDELATIDVIYMKRLPGDPSTYDYCYQSDGSFFQIYAYLENENDASSDVNIVGVDYECYGDLTSYNYGISSSNMLPESPTPMP